MESRLIVVVLAIGVVVSLTGCIQPGGPVTQEWLRSQAMVSSVNLKYDVEGLQEFPELTATITPSASDAALTRLATKSASYLSAKAKQRISITLDVSGRSLHVEPSQPASTVAEWVTLRSDRRILNAKITGGAVALYADRADVVALYRHYVAGLPLSVSQDPDLGAGVQIGSDKPCVPPAAGLNFATSVAANAKVASARLDPCGASAVTVRDLSELVSVASSLRSTAPENLSIGYEKDSNNSPPTDIFTISESAATPNRLAFFADVERIGGVDGAVLADDGALAIDGDLPSTAGPVFADPKHASVSAISITGNRLTVGATSQSEFDADYALGNTLRALGTYTYVLVTPTTVSVTFLVDAGKKINDYVKYGKRAVAAIAATALWKGRTVTVQDDSDSGVRFVDGVGSVVGEATPSAPALITYWGALTN